MYTLLIIVILAYIVWSVFAIRDLIEYGDTQCDEYVILWITVTIIMTIVGIIVLCVHYDPLQFIFK